MKILSNWRSVKLWETQLERRLHHDHSLRTHGLLIGTCTLLLMWGVSALQMWAGGSSLAVRYAITLGIGYIGYLLIIRFWARRLVAQRTDFNADPGDLPGDLVPDVLPSPRGWNAGGGGDYAGGAFEAAASADEGAIVVVPVVAIFLICSAVLFGAGALALVFFGVDALLAVAVEVAFSYVSARAAVRVAREGWLMAAVRLTWKPLLGALLCAVALGATLDHFLPHVRSLPEAVRLLLHR